MTELERIASALQADLHNHGLMVVPKNHIPQAAYRILAALQEAVIAERKASADLLMELSKIAETAKECMAVIEEPVHADRHRIRSETFAQAAAAILARGEQT